MDSPLAYRVGQFVGHRRQVLSRGEKHNPAIAPRVVVAISVRLHEQHDGSSVDGPRKVEISGGQRTQGPKSRSGMVRNQDVQRSELRDGEFDDAARCFGIGEVGFDAPQSIVLASEGFDHPLHTCRIGAPGLLGIMPRPRVHDNAGAFSEHPLSYAKADSRPSAYAGDESNPPSQKHLPQTLAPPSP
jgi:hypothetical protein